MDLYDRNRLGTPNLKYANSSSNYYAIMIVQNLKKVLKLKISNFFLIHEANNNREAVVVCAKHVVKQPSKRSVLYIYICVYVYIYVYMFRID